MEDHGRSTLPPAVYPLGVAAVWAALCLWLAADGHAPSRGVPGLDPAMHYYLQAGALPLVLTLQWMVLAWVSARVARALGATADWQATGRAVAAPWGLSLLLVLVLPDLVAYAVGGFEALTAVVPITAPALLVVTWAAVGRALARAHDLSPGRAALAALAGLLAQALVGAPILR